MQNPEYTKYGLHGKLTAQQGKGDELAAILLQASELLKTAKGCHLYVISKDHQNADTVWIYEVWDSKEDHDNSLQLTGVRELIGKAIPILAGQPEKGVEFTVLGGTGLN
ncbi:antibiotic biosynthesis monooxygenase [Pontibacter sp. BT310]|uniref:Antibiotic biosynthesis monooxygenase n=1 Tax=Pontibacter populi TaxID=890055 RepID=A0ABS6XCH9_9BACT|nr:MULTISPECIES: antibiotic biosynthesis monooxygenase [Pontibacter]MBJ6118805.1 antibiotic biosynthesis monooxygenase [Pontibacter sp. BT310]MBR0571233.1 antibiotic biosynthesis monooxygenase [Microvirga sp. STS03]MBW3365659.1 antibiotic biosynthesis monooxygenase [Pontibacter populi]